MKRSIAWCVLLLGLSITASGYAQESVDDLASLKRQNAELRDQLAEMKSANEKLQAEADGLRAELTRLKSSNEDLQVQTKELTELAGLTPAGDRVETAASRFTTSFDQNTGQTVVRSSVEKLQVMRGSAAEHWISLAYAYPGKEIQAPPDRVTLFIQARFSGGIYNGQSTALFDLDGETVRVPIAQYDKGRRQISVAGRRARDKSDETLTFEIDQDLLRRLARAIQLKITIGTVELELSRDQTAMFRAIRKRMELGA